MSECWVFDVDGCLVDSLSGTSLRPGARELLEHLRRSQCTVVWWSAAGGSYAEARARRFGIAHLVDAYDTKAARDASGRYVTDRVVGRARSAVFVDDRPEDLPASVTVLAVSPYLSENPSDRGLDAVARHAGMVAPPAGRSPDPGA